MGACEEELGVVGAALVFVREERAVRGVGALIKDFLGVSVTCFPLLPPRLDEENVAFVADRTGLGRRPAVTKGWRIAACGFILRSGSHTKHLEIKSTNSSSLHRKT